MHFQERIHAMRQRSRERFDHARRISQQAQERLARLHNNIQRCRTSLDANTAESNNSGGASGNEDTNPNIVTENEINSSAVCVFPNNSMTSNLF